MVQVEIRIGQCQAAIRLLQGLRIAFAVEHGAQLIPAVTSIARVSRRRLFEELPPWQLCILEP